MVTTNNMFESSNEYKKAFLILPESYNKNVITPKQAINLAKKGFFNNGSQEYTRWSINEHNNNAMLNNLACDVSNFGALEKISRETFFSFDKKIVRIKSKEDENLRYNYQILIDTLDKNKMRTIKQYEGTSFENIEDYKTLIELLGKRLGSLKEIKYESSFGGVNYDLSLVEVQKTGEEEDVYFFPLVSIEGKEPVGIESVRAIMNFYLGNRTFEKDNQKLVSFEGFDEVYRVGPWNSTDIAIAFLQKEFPSKNLFSNYKRL